MKIRGAIAILVVASCLAGFGVAELISTGLSYSKAVATDLARTTGREA